MIDYRTRVGSLYESLGRVYCDFRVARITPHAEAMILCKNQDCSIAMKLCRTVLPSHKRLWGKHATVVGMLFVRLSKQLGQRETSASHWQLSSRT
jgi:hypothetical protein